MYFKWSKRIKRIFLGVKAYTKNKMGVSQTFAIHSLSTSIRAYMQACYDFGFQRHLPSLRGSLAGIVRAYSRGREGPGQKNARTYTGLLGQYEQSESECISIGSRLQMK